ncbi:bifunctional 26S Proteasome non-ATPase regulatory subunit 12-COP9 signalosome complex subunit 4/Winged helix DNA-binding domain superfamily/26S Proteasome non-ATPase regulatory subunit 12/Proteasome component (PCI) domain/Winged helix-like DNA-binding domain superfamily/26S proteasome regulatory subunit RPN5 [Babesia duncani]|uniref:PCI domain-containing protein n=1 Tax=Babesia duncani TaxID=323732 RepID=A0AAD9UMX9_9APIC|nr:bifunctional 26S Proteasome non-ATPase regulatory subunit 12-COP9 signalosome complex subunit 4/Winged helix DNA-binding domain superfamily/26S Proteasome non-ATPase regulatory subunit 12/Proteasome component (PCI) domain/Winged helix-like DNA-binding domain superfamily/26S proteasome regulatory subunit RPN5 [Babesia duncani]
MDADIIDVLGQDSYLKDPPMTEDLSQLVAPTISDASVKLQGFASRDDAYLRSVFLDLMLMEKKCRLAFDGESGAKICTFVLQVLYDNKDYDNVNYYLLTLNKKRGQLKKSIMAMVDLAKGWIPQITDMDRKLQLIESLNQITTGKMFLESQRAEIMFGLAKLKEEAGDIPAAAKIIQNVEVETFGSLGKREKAEYILDQMRIQLLDCDYIRFYMTSKKINEKLLECDDFAPIKLRFLEYMVKYYLYEEKYLEIAKACYQRTLTFLRLQDDSWLQELECCILFALIAPTTKECNEFLIQLKESQARQIKHMELLGPFFEEFLLDNLLPWPLEPRLAECISSHLVFQDTPLPGGQARLETLRNRIVQHNIKVMSKFYTKISLERLAELANATIDMVESEISNMVNINAVQAKIDRVAGVVQFGQKKDPETILNEWSKSITGLISIVDQTSRLVQKEKMIHEARAKQLELDAYMSK